MTSASVARAARRIAVATATLGMLITAPSALAETVTRTYVYTGADQTFVVPAGVTSVNVVAIGGDGGEAFGSFGGQGAQVSAPLSTTPGSTLYVEVGREGASTTEFCGPMGCEGGEGGVASDIRTAPRSAGLSPDPRLLVAGAGGGAGSATPEHASGEGANAGQAAETWDMAGGGGAGTQSAGGAGGASSCENGTFTNGTDGQLELGGRGGYCSRFGGNRAGGGGDGYYGGGGGGQGLLAGAGGGGGSSLVPEGGSVAVSGAVPLISISYTQPPNAPAVITGEATTVRETTATLNATVNPEHETVTACTFEYGTSEAYGQSAPCSSAPGSGIAPVAVSAGLAGLTGRTTYHYRIAATNGSGTSYGADRTFTTLKSEPPVVTSVTPKEGSGAGGTSVTIKGTEMEGATAVKFGSTEAASFTVNSNESITAVSPAGVGTVDVTVKNAGGTSSTGSADRFTYVPRPVVTSVDRPDGGEAGGGTVRLRGSGFTGATAVQFGGVPATSFKASFDNEMTAVAPAGAAGTVYITVTVPVGGTSEAAARDAYHYLSGVNAGPELGRCVGQTYPSYYSANTCLTSTVRRTGTFEWEPLALKTGFTLTAGKLILETTGKAKTTCVGGHGSGSFSGTKDLSGVTLLLEGCATGTKKCTTPGLTEGHVELAVLEGVMEWTGKYGTKPGYAISPVGHSGAFLTYACAGVTTTLEGSVISSSPITGKMLTTAVVKFAEKEGKQVPEAKEGQPPSLLKNSHGEQVGMSVTLTELREEALELSSNI